MNIFISYRRRHEPSNALAHFLAEQLRGVAHEVFIDTGITGGTEWSQEIGARLDWCDVFVVLLCEEALNSEAISAEVEMAYEREDRPLMVPIRVALDPGRTLPYGLRICLRRLQYLEWKDPEHNDGVLQDVHQAIRRKQAGTDGEDADREPEPDPGPALSPPAGVAAEPQRPAPVIDAGAYAHAYTAPGGMLRIDDHYYVERRADLELGNRAALEGQTTVIQAPRQMGKTSALMRYLAKCSRHKKRIAFIDFQQFSTTELASGPSLLRSLAVSLLRALKIRAEVPARLENPRELTYFVEDEILTRVQEPMVLAFDRIDRVLGLPYQEDFFYTLRTWHEKRGQEVFPWAAPDADDASPGSAPWEDSVGVGQQKTNRESSWENVDLALVISTEPKLLVDKADRSPFNVTPPVLLETFDLQQVCTLSERYPAPLSDGQVAALYALLDGHPFLTRHAFYLLGGTHSMDFNSLLDTADTSDGPFGGHLRALQLRLERKPELVKRVRACLQECEEPEDPAYHVLHAAGLVRRNGSSWVPASALYARFFQRVFKPGR